MDDPDIVERDLVCLEFDCHHLGLIHPGAVDLAVQRRVELTRIRGHLTLWGGGIHHAEIKTAVRAGVPAPDG